VKPEGGKDPAQAKLKECDMEMENAISGDSGMDALEMGAGSEGSAADDVELTFQIDVDDLEALLNGAVESSFVAEPSVAAAVSTDDDTEIEVVDDDTADSSSDLDGEMLMDTEKEKKEMPMESKKPAGKSAPLKEHAVIAKAATAVKTLKTQLVESQLLTAKALYVSKFAVRDDLTKKQKQKIAEYFDKAKTITEAKETYVKIKKILSENAPSSAKLSGSASMATSSGSATLNESVGPNASGDQVETQRWKLLAGIKSKK
jgi:G3E family GTPase